jgi:hypothetical protein
MKRTLGAAWLYPLCFSFGCTAATPLGGGPNSQDPQTSDGGGNSGGAGNVSNNAGSGNNYNPGTGGKGNITNTTPSTSTAPPPLDSGCASGETLAALTRINIVFLLDKSGSMGDDPNGGWKYAETRWNPVVTTLRSFFQEHTSTGIYASLSFLPADGDITSMCKVTNYQLPSSNSIKVPLTILDNVGSQKFLAKLCDPALTPPAAGCIVPAGGTPTRVALQGTIAYAASVQQKSLEQNPNSKTVIVFLTDGEPGFGYVPTGTSTVNGLASCDDLTNGCPLGPAPSATGTCTADADEVQHVADVIAAAPPKTLFLFGIGDLNPGTMALWEDASGNTAVALQGMSGAQAAATFKAGLEAIRTSHISCTLDLKSSSTGVAIDPKKVNVNYINGQNVATELVQDADCSHTNQYGWYYDNALNPTKITLCASACTMAQADPNGRIQTVLGCDTRQPIL